jgi:hypothetical protein
MSDSVAYALREEFAGTVLQYETVEDESNGNGVEVPAFTGGLVSVGSTGRELNLRELLDEEPHPGLIVVDATDTPALVALDELAVLERVDAPAGEPEVNAGPTGNELRERAKAEGLTHYGSLKVAELELALERHADAIAAASRLEEHPLAGVTDARELAAYTVEGEDS